MTRARASHSAAALAAAALLAGCAGEGRQFGEDFGAGWTEGSVEVVWTARVGSVTRKNGIARAGDELCVTNRDGQVMFVDIGSGETRVGGELGGAVSAGGPCTKGTAAAVAEDGRLVVSDLAGGSRSWSRPLNGYPLGPLIGAAGSVISAHPSGEVISYSLLSGDELWRLELQQAEFRFDGSFRPRLDGDFLYMGTPEGSLVAINVIDGFVAWNERLFTSRSPDPTANLSLVAGPGLGSGLACASAFNGNTACFDAQTGRKAWETEMSSAGTLDAIGETVYLVSQSGALVGLALDSGRERFRAEGASSSRSPVVVAHRGRLVVVNGFAGLSVHDAGDGSALGGLRIGGQVVDIADLGPDGLAVLSSTGELRRVELR